MEYNDLDIDAQRALRRASAIERRTLIERWATMREGDTPRGQLSWTRRAELASTLIAPGRRVADVGCGRMLLEPFLPAGTHYIPIDVAPRDSRTIVVDLNREPLPDVGADVVVGLAVLEYLADVPAFLNQISCDAVLSYMPVDLSPKRDRQEYGLFNAYTTREIRGLFKAAGFHIDRWLIGPARHRIWKLTHR